MKLLALDIGNTHVTCGIYEKKWVEIIRIPSNLNFWDSFSKIKKHEISHAAISSVVPKLNSIYEEAIRNLFKLDPFIINHENCGIKLLVDKPNEVGIDRICNTAAIKKNNFPTIIGDIGSATNYDVVNENGAFIGGAISPGIKTAANNLFKKAALLQETTFIIPPSTIGKNTKTNLQSGIMFGAIDVIDGMFKRIETELNLKNVNKIITGGFGKLISPHLKTKHKLLPHLTLDGIRRIFENSI